MLLVRDPPITTGSKGNIQGARTVRNPAIKDASKIDSIEIIIAYYNLSAMIRVISNCSISISFAASINIPLFSSFLMFL